MSTLQVRMKDEDGAALAEIQRAAGVNRSEAVRLALRVTAERMASSRRQAAGQQLALARESLAAAMELLAAEGVV